ncbi:hypothetical protein, partial [Yoonia sp.]|uniref:hypothetical protein n=1 Tax=Yoonia sp. TaxID=2212373 RepID=UPI0039755AC0
MTRSPKHADRRTRISETATVVRQRCCREDKIGGKEEDDIYEALGLPYIEPELREKRGELDIESAEEL